MSRKIRPGQVAFIIQKAGTVRQTNKDQWGEPAFYFLGDEKEYKEAEAINTKELLGWIMREEKKARAFNKKRLKKRKEAE